MEVRRQGVQPELEHGREVRSIKMSKKDLGVVPAVYPMPVLIVAAYDKDGKVNHQRGSQDDEEHP